MSYDAWKLSSQYDNELSSSQLDEIVELNGLDSTDDIMDEHIDQYHIDIREIGY